MKPTCSAVKNKTRCDWSAKRIRTEGRRRGSNYVGRPMLVDPGDVTFIAPPRLCNLGERSAWVFAATTQLLRATKTGAKNTRKGAKPSKSVSRRTTRGARESSTFKCWPHSDLDLNQQISVVFPFPNAILFFFYWLPGKWHDI